jgi:hypothetical protein
MIIPIAKNLGLTCYTRESCTAADVGCVNHIVDLVMSESHHVPTCDYIQIFSGWASCMLKKRKKLRAKKMERRRYWLTRTVFPSLLLHQMIEFRCTIARVLRTIKVGRLLTFLAPHMVAVRKRTSDDLGVFMVVSGHEHRPLAPISVLAEGRASEYHGRTFDSIREQRKKPFPSRSRYCTARR